MHTSSLELIALRGVWTQIYNYIKAVQCSHTRFLGSGRHSAGQRVGVDPALGALLARAHWHVHCVPGVGSSHHRQAVKRRVLVVCQKSSKISFNMHTPIFLFIVFHPILIPSSLYSRSPVLIPAHLVYLVLFSWIIINTYTTNFKPFLLSYVPSCVSGTKQGWRAL